jgi:hypothetical protein
MKKRMCFIGLAGLLVSLSTFADPSSGRYFDHAIFVLFENTNYTNALKQPFFGKLATEGAVFSNFLAATHPSQPNYIALTSGSLHGVSDNSVVDLDVRSIADLLEAKGYTWKVYAEDYPGNCFVGRENDGYARKHNPFISYLSIQKNPTRCAKIVNADEFEQDAAAGTLPNYVFYVPNMKNSGHDTDVSYADAWYAKKFSKYVDSPSFMEKTVLISTFDESGLSPENQIYVSIVGSKVTPGSRAEPLNLYSLLKLVEENWNLGNLGAEDAKAASIPNIWR